MGKVYKNENQILLPQVLEIYQPIDFDWMHTSITKGSVFTLHHIREQNCGGNTSIDNLALLVKKSHKLLKMLETMDCDLYFAWNELFMDINVCKCPPSDYLVKEMILLRKKTMNNIYGNKRS